MLGLPYLVGGISVAALASFLCGVHVGNTYGSAARHYAAVVRELNAKNAELSALKAKDEAEIPKEDATRNQAFDSASATLLRFGSHAKASKVDADVLMGINR